MCSQLYKNHSTLCSAKMGSLISTEALFFTAARFLHVSVDHSECLYLGLAIRLKDIL